MLMFAIDAHEVMVEARLNKEYHIFVGDEHVGKQLNSPNFGGKQITISWFAHLELISRIRFRRVILTTGKRGIYNKTRIVA